VKRTAANLPVRKGPLLARLLAVSLLASAGGASAAASSGMQEADHIQVELISEVRTVGAGEPFWVALRLVPDPGWHTYWRNPGDSGLETRIRWTLPEGVTAGEIAWPTPQHLPVAHIVNYGMEGETFLLTRIETAASLHADRPIQVQANAAWLVCEVDCIPGFAELALELPLGPEAMPAPEHERAFAEARARLPAPAPPGWEAVFEVAEGRFGLALRTGDDALPPGTEARFFPQPTDVVGHSAPQQVEALPDGLRFVQSLSPLFRSPPEQLDGVLVLQRLGSVRGFEISASPGSPAGTQPRASASETDAERPLSGESGDAAPAASDTHSWEPFSEMRLAELRSSGRPVFVNMTADWCTTCRANERRALDTEPVRTAFRARDVAYLKGDWAEQDPEITRYLARHGSRGVPLYVLYPPDPAAAPRRLPPMLTPEIVVEALEAALAAHEPHRP
jgi:DsbC/DsbD-like thiol-disulfide interchange protein